MRPDVFEINKSLHVKLNKDLYIAFRVEAFQRGLTMQEMFAIFAKLVVEKNPQITKFLDAYSIQKIKNKLKKSADIVVLYDRRKVNPDRRKLHTYLANDQRIGIVDRRNRTKNKRAEIRSH